MNALFQSARDTLGTELFRLGDSPVTLATVLGILTVLVVTVWLSRLKNFTLRDSSYRIRASVGVSYGSDMAMVKSTLQAVSEEISARWAVPGHEPQVILAEVGTSAVVWEVAIWMSDPWRFTPALSDLHEAVSFALKRAGIVVAFPQVDVHLDAPVVAAVERLGSPEAA